MLALSSWPSHAGPPMLALPCWPSHAGAPMLALPCWPTHAGPHMLAIPATASHAPPHTCPPACPHTRMQRPTLCTLQDLSVCIPSMHSCIQAIIGSPPVCMQSSSVGSPPVCMYPLGSTPLCIPLHPPDPLSLCSSSLAPFSAHLSLPLPHPLSTSTSPGHPQVQPGADCAATGGHHRPGVL